MRWCARHRTWGSAIDERWDAVRVDGSPVAVEAVEQNLRLQATTWTARPGCTTTPFGTTTEHGALHQPRSDPIGLAGRLDLQQYAANPLS
ncbi:hypothetical protein M4R22_11680 [Acidovorax sp. GBBC 3334]|nr:hypothetical protein [Acidovorax sp. GBBC 3334]